MSISQISNSSVSDLQLTLTSPFLVKKVSINAHTPYDKPEEIPETYSKASLELR